VPKKLKINAVEEEYGLRVFDVRALRKIFRSKRGSIRRMEKTAYCRDSLHIEEVHNLYFSPEVTERSNYGQLNWPGM
jgi:hypothetical protein